MRRRIFMLLLSSPTWLAFGWLAFCSPLEAAVISRDWKTPGDGLLTYDDVNRREWLDLSVTFAFPSPGRYEKGVAELAPGGLFEGFRVAKRDDVRALAQSAGIDTTTIDIARNGEPTRRLIELLWPVFTNPQGFALSTGYLDELGQQVPPRHECPCRFGMILQINPTGLATGQAFLGFGFGGSNDGIRDPGAMLFREVVPEPAANVLGAAVVTALSALLRTRTSPSCR